MIPPFNKNGYLPEGVHRATLSEIEARFGIGTELRRVQMESLRWMVDLAVKAGVKRIILNGSFVTDIIEPNDVDCALVLKSGGALDRIAEEELKKGLPFVDISFADPSDVDYFTKGFFAHDRLWSRKGMIEVVI